MARPMAQLVQGGGIVAVSRGELALVGKVDAVGRQMVERAVRSVPEGGAGRLEDGLGPRAGLPRRRLALDRR